MDWVWNLWRENALLAVGIVMFLGALGVPVPVMITLLATGAYARQGGVSPFLAYAVALGAAVLADQVSYSIARWKLDGHLSRLQRKRRWRNATRRFEKNAFLTLYLSRWVFTPLAVPTAYIAGASRFSRPRFVAASFLGHLTGVGIYAGLGYAFSSTWRKVASALSRYEIPIFVCLILAGLGFAIYIRRNGSSEKSKDKASGEGTSSPEAPNPQAA